MILNEADVISLEIKCTVNVMHLNHSQTNLLPSSWKNCLHETGLAVLAHLLVNICTHFFVDGMASCLSWCFRSCSRLWYSCLEEVISCTFLEVSSNSPGCWCHMEELGRNPHLWTFTRSSSLLLFKLPELNDYSSERWASLCCSLLLKWQKRGTEISGKQCQDSVFGFTFIGPKIHLYLHN